MTEPTNASVALDIEALSTLLELATEAQESVEDIRLDEAKVALTSLTAWLWSYQDFAKQKGANMASSVAHSFDEKGEEAGGNAGSIPAASTTEERQHRNFAGTAQEQRRDFVGTPQSDCEELEKRLMKRFEALNIHVNEEHDDLIEAHDYTRAKIERTDEELRLLRRRVSSVEEGIEASFETDEQLQELSHRVKLLEARFRQ